MDSRIRGFTFLELMVALTIMGMLLMLGMPSFTTFVRNSEVRSTTESISNGLRAARSEATRLNRPVSFTLAAGTDPSWTINVFNPVSGTLIQPRSSSIRASKLARARRSPACPQLPSR
jgi:type IV fimbrial biogenesis protein FimT